jgi:hypothetical protein
MIWAFGYSSVLQFPTFNPSNDEVFVIKVYSLIAMTVVVVSGLGGVLTRYWSIAPPSSAPTAAGGSARPTNGH